MLPLSGIMGYCSMRKGHDEIVQATQEGISTGRRVRGKKFPVSRIWMAVGRESCFRYGHQKKSNISVFTSTSSMQWRFNTWSFALQDIIEIPVIGIGFGKHSFSSLHPDLGPGFHANLHNSFLERAVQVGVPGFLFFNLDFLGGGSQSYSSFS